MKKENNKSESKSLKKLLKKNLKEVKAEKKKAIKEVQKEKKKAIKAIKKLSRYNEPFLKDNSEESAGNSSSSHTKSEETGFKNKEESTGKKEKIAKEKLEKNIERSSEATSTTYKSGDFKSDEAISRLMALSSVQDIDDFVSNEKRSTINKAAENRKSELNAAS